MLQTPLINEVTLASILDAAQHRPRPLPLFLSMLRSETAGEPDRTAAALKGLRAYQQAKRSGGPPAMPIIARAGRASVRDYGGKGPTVLFVPSLINPPDVLDVDPDRSLLRWLAGQGVRPLLLDWGAPTADEHGLSIAGHIETMLIPLIDAIGVPVSLVGYCLGGTMAIAAAALRPVTALVLIAAPWRFQEYPDATRNALAELWTAAEPTVEALGLLPMEILQAAFWRLDPKRTIDKYEVHGTRGADEPASRSFVRLEDWANDGPPLTGGAARDLFHHMFANDLPGQGGWIVGGARINPAALTMPVLAIASTTDHIVPAATTATVGERIDLALGHVGMIVGGRAKAALWEPLAKWLSHVGPQR